MSQSTLAPGALFHSRYQIQRAIRSGGMGEVYRAIDKETGMAVAIKRMLVEASSDGSDQGAAYHHQRFEEEVKILQNLNFPGIPTFVDSFLDGERRVIVMEFIEGVDLEKQVVDQQTLAGAELPVLVAVNYTIQVAKILEYLHAYRPRPIVHRDVKPANIIVRHQDNRLYLVDFGLAREVGGSTSTKTAVGTVGYAPLEQYRGHPTTRTDQYSLGVTLHYMLSGKQPLPLQIEPLDKLRDDLPHELCWVVRKATMQEQEDRWDSVYEFRRELEKLIPVLEAHQQQLLLREQADDRMTLLGPTQELSEPTRPVQRVKIEGVHQVADEPMKDFGLYNPLQNSLSLQQNYQRDAMQAEQRQRMVDSSIESSGRGSSSRLHTLILLSMLLGVVVLYFLNRHHQISLAASILQGPIQVIEAVGMGRRGTTVLIGRGQLGPIERLLAFPIPASDGIRAQIPANCRSVELVTENPEPELPFYLGILDQAGKSVESNWLVGQKTGWRRVSAKAGDFPSLNSELHVPEKGRFREFKARWPKLPVQGGFLLLVVPPKSGKLLRVRLIVEAGETEKGRK